MGEKTGKLINEFPKTIIPCTTNHIGKNASMFSETRANMQRPERRTIVIYTIGGKKSKNILAYEKKSRETRGGFASAHVQ